jgi:hypothetical protein
MGNRVWGRGEVPRPRLICSASQPEDATVGGAASTVGGQGVGFGVWLGGPLLGLAALVPGIGPLSGHLISSRASGRPAVPG